MSWGALKAEAGELADFGATRLAASDVAYLATVDEHGAPRVHPVTPVVADGRLVVFMESTSPKGRDLERGSRYALHSAVEDRHGAGGEFVVRGSARRIHDPQVRALAAGQAPYTPEDRYVLFELLVDYALTSVYAEDGTPIRRRWRAREVG